MLYVPLPCAHERLAVLRTLTRRSPLADDVDLEEVAADPRAEVRLASYLAGCFASWLPGSLAAWLAIWQARCTAGLPTRPDRRRGSSGWCCLVWRWGPDEQACSLELH